MRNRCFCIAGLIILLALKVYPAHAADPYSLGTSGSYQSQFNRYATANGQPPIRFPGMLVGTEKIKMEIIGAPKRPELSNSKYLSSRAKKEIYDFLSDGESKRNVITHAYSSRSGWVTNEYSGSAPEGTLYARQKDHWSAIQTELQNLAAVHRPSHIIVYVKGFFTSQEKAIARANQFYDSMLNADMKTVGSPLLVVVTWPSKNPVTAKQDSDEFGFLTLNRLLTQAVYPVAHGGTPVILVGHSLGARAVTRAAYSHHFFGVENASYALPDVRVVGFQGMFSLNRFVSGGGNEGYPYAVGLPKPQYVVLTNSGNDKALKEASRLPGIRVAGWTEDARKISGRHPTKFEFVKLGSSIDWSANTPKLLDASAAITSHSDVDDVDAALIVDLVAKPN